MNHSPGSPAAASGASLVAPALAHGQSKLPVAWWALGGNAVLAAWLWLHPLGHRNAAFVADLFNAAIPLAAALWLLLPAWRGLGLATGLARRRRLAVFCLGMGLLFYGIASAVWLRIDFGPGAHVLFPSLADMLYPFSFPWLLAGIWLLPRVAHSLARRFRIALDCLIAACVTATFVWYYLLAPTWPGIRVSLLQLALSLAYPIGLLVLLYSLLALMKSEAEDPMGRPVFLLGAGIFCILGAVTVFASESLKGRYTVGGVLDAAWPIGYTLIALAGRDMLRADASQPGEVQLANDYHREWRNWSGLLPYGLMSIALALGWYTRRIGTAQRVEMGVEIGVGIVVVLVVVRQIVDYLDGRRLYSMLYKSHLALQEMGEDLERRVDHRTRQLQRANRDLESLTYSIAHDLRSPLRSINGFADTLIEEYGPKLDEQGFFYLRRIATASDHLGEVMDAISRLAHVSQHELQRESVDLSLMAHEVADCLSLAIPGRLADWRIQDGIVARGDKRLLRMVIDDLMANAWQFTEGRAPAEIIFACEENKGRVTYRICDNGIGFDPESATRLFQPFQRLHSSAEPGRVGIGLALAQRIVQKHGGEIWAEGEPGTGACFYFTLEMPAPEVDDAGHPEEA